MRTFEHLSERIPKPPRMIPVFVSDDNSVYIGITQTLFLTRLMKGKWGKRNQFGFIVVHQETLKMHHSKCFKNFLVSCLHTTSNYPFLVLLAFDTPPFANPASIHHRSPSNRKKSICIQTAPIIPKEPSHRQSCSLPSNKMSARIVPPRFPALQLPKEATRDHNAHLPSPFRPMR